MHTKYNADNLIRPLGVKLLPSPYKEWLRQEHLQNDRVAGSLFGVQNFDQLDPMWDPFNQPVWDIAYLEIPVGLCWGLSRKPKNSALLDMIQVCRDGQYFERFFVHPQMEGEYKEEMESWGKTCSERGKKCFYRGKFRATVSASARSLFLWDVDNEDVILGQKVSLNIEIGGGLRVNFKDMLVKAFAINCAIQNIPRKTRDAIGFDFFPEFQMQSTMEKGVDSCKNYGNVVRDLSLLKPHDNGKPAAVPAFSLFCRGLDGSPPVLINQIQKSNHCPCHFIEKRILRPLLEFFSYMTLFEGLEGEPHLQNIMFRLDDEGTLQDKIFVKDMDGYRPDIEQRYIHNLPNQHFLDMENPYMQMSINEAYRYTICYVKYVKNVWGEHIESFLSTYFMNDAGTVGTDWAEIIDKMFLRLLHKYVGFNAIVDAGDMRAHLAVVEQLDLKEEGGAEFSAAKLNAARKTECRSFFPDFVYLNAKRLNRILPHIKWDKEETPKLSNKEFDLFLNEFSINEIFNMDQENRCNRFMFDLNAIIKRYQELNRKQSRGYFNQDILASEFLRLHSAGRGSGFNKKAKVNNYIIHDGIIYARGKKNRPLGYAFLEPKSYLYSNRENFYSEEKARYEPDKALLARLFLLGP